MKRLLHNLALTASITLFHSTVFGQDFQWVVHNGGPQDEILDRMVIDDNGNLFIASRFDGNTAHNPDTTSSWISSNGDDDIYLQKIDLEGNVLWTKTIGGSGEDQVYGLELDQNNNLLIVGSFKDSVDFDPNSGEHWETADSSVARNGFFLRLDENGNFLSVSILHSKLNLRIRDITLDSNGEVLLLGDFYETVDLDWGPDTASFISEGITDIFILKLDGNYNFEWAKTFGGLYNDLFFELILDGSDNIYATGQYIGTVDFDPGTGTHFETATGQTDIAVVKLNSVGDFLWAKTYGGTGGDYGLDLISNESGFLYLTSRFSGGVQFDQFQATSNGSYDLAILKIDQADGALEGFYTVGGNQFDFTKGLNLDTNGNIVLSGYFGESADFGTPVKPRVLIASGSLDAFALILSPNLEFHEAFHFGGTENDGAYYSTIHKNSLYIGGIFRSECDFGLGGSEEKRSSAGGRDVFISKVDLYNYSNNSSSILSPTYNGESHAFPNPSNGFLRIIGIQAPVQFSLCNHLGQQVLGGTFYLESSELNLSTLPVGMYYLNYANTHQKIHLVK